MDDFPSSSYRELALLRRQGGFRPARSPCGICGQAQGSFVFEHCHAHDAVRGEACYRCNFAMAAVDRGARWEEGAPRTMEALLAWHSKVYW
jgi:hypothetical protein